MRLLWGQLYFDFVEGSERIMFLPRVLGCAAEKSDIHRGIYGTGAHSDYGLLTLLATDDVPGLQVQTTSYIPA